jgi:anti-sigma regulatory factor (Ser/Thr protein kinase)
VNLSLGSGYVVNACIGIQEQTDAAQVRRTALAFASGLSFDEVSAGNVGLVVTEAATNILKHAGAGQVVLRSLECAGAAGIEMLALDKGPGIADPGRCFKDGYSTAGTSGTGLGAIARLATRHDVYSVQGQGTVLMAQVWRGGRSCEPPGPAKRFCIGGVGVAMAGEQECGDDWVFQEIGRGGRMTVADGLGHGENAAIAARAAIRTAREHVSEPAHSLLERIHGALRHTRGATVAVAEIDLAAQVVRFAGVGNIAAAVVTASGMMRRLVSLAGTAGHEVRKMVEFTYPWESGALLLMHSDGLQTHWSFDSYPGLLNRHPSLIAGVLYRDHARGRDDVTVVVARETGPGS